MVEKMSAIDQTSRASSALKKRQDSIKKWKDSPTAKEPADHPQNSIKFDLGTVFLSAISSGDIDEALDLLNKGVDINYANVDGLTALHQACIDENLEIVDMLVKRGANLDARDNEGWTCLHAAASAGNVEIAQFLIEHNADLVAVNNEGEVPFDLAEEEEMEEFLSEEMDKQDLQAEAVKDEEERYMTEEATSCINKGKVNDILDVVDWQGATPLHVAAAKGYNKFLNLVTSSGVYVNQKDYDSWTPLHAAIHWGQKNAGEILTEAGADFAIRNNIGQTACDLAEGEMIKFSEELRKRAKELSKDGISKVNQSKIIDSKGPPPLKRRTSVTRISGKDKILGGISDKQQERETLKVLPNSANHNPDLKPKRSALKGGRAKQNGTSINDESESESESEESEESEPEPEIKPPSFNVSAPLRPPSMPQRPSTTASTEKVSSPRTPSSIPQIAPLRPPNKDDKKEESKSDSITARLNSRLGKRDDDKKDSDNVSNRFSIPRPGDRVDNIPRPLQQRNEVHKNESKEEEKKDIKPPSRADELRSKFNIPRPGENTGGSALDRYRKNKEKEEIEDITSRRSRNRKDEESEKQDNTAKAEEAPSRARPNLFNPPERPGRGVPRDEKKANDTPPTYVGNKNRFGADREEKEEKPAEDTLSIRKRLADRQREREKDKENDRDKELEKERKEKERKEQEERERKEKERKEQEQKEKNDEDSPFSGQRARRARNIRQTRKSTGVIIMPEDPNEVENEEKRETKRNTRANEDSIENLNSTTAKIFESDMDQPRLSLAERLRRSREKDTNVSSPSTTSSVTSSRFGSKGREDSSSIKASIDTTDTKELQRKLKDALENIEDYKSKLDKANKEKEDLKKKLEQFQEDIKKLEDDNNRMKVENGALIRVVSKLSGRT